MSITTLSSMPIATPPSNNIREEIWNLQSKSIRTVSMNWENERYLVKIEQKKTEGIFLSIVFTTTNSLPKTLKNFIKSGRPDDSIKIKFSKDNHVETDKIELPESLSLEGQETPTDSNDDESAGQCDPVSDHFEFDFEMDND